MLAERFDEGELWGSRTSLIRTVDELPVRLVP
jgi:hypothetical protein